MASPQGEGVIVTARKLAHASPRRPRQADLRRSISTAYYALFNAVAQDAADVLVGTGTLRASRTWGQTYRAVEHGFAKNACREAPRHPFPPGIQVCADAFVRLQEIRHQADYDPEARFKRVDAINWVADAEAAIAGLRSAPRADRRAFAIHILLKKRP